MTQKEYETAIAVAQEMILNTIHLFEEELDRWKDEIVELHQTDKLRSLLNIGLLVAHTERGKAMFLDILQFSTKIDAQIANEYWNHFDDLDNLVKKRYFKIRLNPPNDINANKPIVE
ncbi:MAG: hypothetical protein LBV74_16335 [Tannerella sp.]|jgi:hypothetical protein|nr:hypothetical protein [Tannerella sp.]